MIEKGTEVAVLGPNREVIGVNGFVRSSSTCKDQQGRDFLIYRVEVLPADWKVVNRVWDQAGHYVTYQFDGTIGCAEEFVVEV